MTIPTRFVHVSKCHTVRVPSRRGYDLANLIW